MSNGTWNCDARGDIESMDLLAGQGVGLVGQIKPAGQIVRELVEEARQIVSQRLAGLVARGAVEGGEVDLTEGVR
jgi:NAD(P)H-dependent flavin oxidoreductase YrpB (nitropropane dioxygenase family)